MKLKKIINESSLKGLHKARPGDYIKIGIEGSRTKWTTQIDKIVSNNRLQDKYGNIFDRNGIIYRRKGYPFGGTKGKIISAKLVTQSEFDKEYKDVKIEYLRKYDWDKEDIKTIEAIINMLKVRQANVKQQSRF